MAREQAQKNGEPLVEKTIFIVKPIYVPVEVPVGKTTGETGPMTQKKKVKVKSKQQKAIYMERLKAPNYTSAAASSLVESKSKKPTSKVGSKQTQHSDSRMLNNRSPSPFRDINEQSMMAVALNQNSREEELETHSPQKPDNPMDMDELNTFAAKRKSSPSPELPKTSKDLKQILESSSIINEIFHKRATKLEAKRLEEQKRKEKEEAEYQEMLEANKSLKESMTNRQSGTGSKSTLRQALSIN